MKKSYLWHPCETTVGRKPLRPITHRIICFYPDSAHVKTLGLTNTDDAEIWEYAKANDFVIVSKDSDFHQRSLLYGHPPKFISVLAIAQHLKLFKFCEMKSTSLLSLEREKPRVYWYCRSMKPKKPRLRRYQLKDFTGVNKISSKLS